MFIICLQVYLLFYVQIPVPICFRFRAAIQYLREDLEMKKTYKIDVDCANCANKMEDAANKTEGVRNATVSFMTLKMKVEFEEGADPSSVMQDVRRNCKKVEDDCEVYL